jgi:hypothetical protein
MFLLQGGAHKVTLQNIQTSFMSLPGGQMCSYHLCVECFSLIACVHLACILSIFQECDITGDDIKEVNQYYDQIKVGANKC